MTTPTTPPTPGAPAAPAAPTPPAVPTPPNEIRIIAHSPLFYWWPIWFFGFVFSLWTYASGQRMIIVPSKDGNEKTTITVTGEKDALIRVEGDHTRMVKEATPVEGKKDEYTPRTRASNQPWMGAVYFVMIMIVIVITNVPLRGLWSLIVIITIASMSLLFAFLDLWDNILSALGHIHIYMNMSAYLLLSISLFIAWMVAVWIFDRRTFISFTPGQVTVNEEIGGRERVYDTTQMTVEKQRDDWFRHVILGFGSGDLIVRTAGAERHEIRLPNVLFVGTKIAAITQLIRSRQQASGS